MVLLPPRRHRRTNPKRLSTKIDNIHKATRRRLGLGLTPMSKFVAKSSCVCGGKHAKMCDLEKWEDGKINAMLMGGRDLGYFM